MSQQKSSDLYLSPNQQDLLVAALNSNHSPMQSQSIENNYSSTQQRTNSMSFTPNQTAPGSGHLDFSDDSPYLDFDPDGDYDGTFNFDADGRMIGELPDEYEGSDLHDKRKSIDDDDEDEGGGKRREGDDKSGKKPGRKPLTSEPTTKRKAQNRAAQRAFRERKEQHLKDLETKVEDLEKTSESTTHENGLLRAQVERLQVELKEYRKRLSWVSSNGTGRSQQSTTGIQSQHASMNNTNDFQFEFPKFGDLPATSIFGNASSQKPQGNSTSRSATLPASAFPATQSPIHRQSTSALGSQSNSGSLSQSPFANKISASPQSQATRKVPQGSVDSLTGLFSPSVLAASRNPAYGYFPQNNVSISPTAGNNVENGFGARSAQYSHSSMSNSDSPGSSSDSHHPANSSIGTSPEPSLSSPGNKLSDFGLNTINEESNVPLNTFGDQAYIPDLDPNGINWLAQQNGGGFDPVLFGDFRETQDNVLSQDFGSFFNDAYPLPDLGSPLHNFNDIAPEQPAMKIDLIQQVEAAKEGGEEVVPAENPATLMSCNKIWDRLQSMEKFRNGEIDIDNLCSELRAKARCSEGGAVVAEKDVNKILGPGL